VLDPSTSPKKLNLGSGSNILEGYDNIDLYYEDPRVIKMDIRRLDYPDDSVDEVFQGCGRCGGGDVPRVETRRGGLR
jgi:hypothetical protein